jgi:Family of unknown function (DUF5320)
MPGLNRTGPQGQGPMTGGARGNCNSANMQGARPATGAMGFGRGMAYGRGYGRNRGNGYSMGMGQGYAGNTGTSVEELNMLRNEVELLNKRIAELEGRL